MAIRETPKGYYVEVFLGRDPLTNKKIRKTKIFTPLSRNSLTEAKIWEANMLTSYKTGELDLKGTMTLSDYLDYWFDTYVITNTSYQTQARYKTLCTCIKEHIGHLQLEKLRTPIIERFYADLKLEKITLKNGTVKRRYMDGTILKTHKLLRQALDKAVAWEMIVKNAADYAKAPKDNDREVSTWSIDETERFLSLIKDSKVYLPTFIAFFTGLREGEICALKWENINLEEYYINVKYNMVQKGKSLELEDPKTKSSKSIVYISEELKIKLEEVKKQQQILWLQSGKTIDFQYVCSWDDGRPLRPLYVAKTFTDFVKQYNFKKITFHGLRHTHASVLYANGATSHEISKRLRHSRVATTDDIYIHLTEEKKKSTADIFSRAVERIK